MTMQVSIQDEYIEKFKQFMNTLPKGAVKIESDNLISFEEAQQKVQKSIDGISLNQGLDLDSAFKEVSNY